jgi:hypothetical protein
MNEFLIECCFKSYNMAPKFDPMTPAGLCHFDPALCGIARDQHIFVNFSANSKQN